MLTGWYKKDSSNLHVFLRNKTSKNSWRACIPSSLSFLFSRGSYYSEYGTFHLHACFYAFVTQACIWRQHEVLFYIFSPFVNGLYYKFPIATFLFSFKGMFGGFHILLLFHHMEIAQLTYPLSHWVSFQYCALATSTVVNVIDCICWCISLG